MNHRDRALAAMRGEPVDRIPFIARMDLWYSYHRSRGTLPHPYEHAELWDLQRDLGIGIFGFGAWDISFYRLSHENVSIEHCAGGETVTRYETPHGVLACRDRMAEQLKDAAGTGARVEYPVKGPDDYDALQYLLEHARIEENFETYGRFIDSIGGDGLALPFSGHLPAHQLMIQWMGYETFYCELHDNERRVEALVEALTQQQRAILALAARCPAQAIEVGGNYDEEMTPPPVFDRFFAPFYREAKETLAAAGKILVAHGDGEMRILLSRLAECGVDVVEALTPRPMTSIDVAETRRLWGDRVAMWGGIPSILLTEQYSDAEFDAYLEDLFRVVAPGNRFLLGFGDNVPTDALFSRVRRVAEFWQAHGGYPIGAGDNQLGTIPDAELEARAAMQLDRAAVAEFSCLCWKQQESSLSSEERAQLDRLLDLYERGQLDKAGAAAVLATRQRLAGADSH